MYWEFDQYSCALSWISDTSRKCERSTFPGLTTRMTRYNGILGEPLDLLVVVDDAYHRQNYIDNFGSY